MTLDVAILAILAAAYVSGAATTYLMMTFLGQRAPARKPWRVGRK